MYTQIKRPSMVVYNGTDDKLIGTATFKFTSEAEQAFLNMLNNGVKPSSLTVMDINLYQTGEDYKPPKLTEVYPREATICATLTDAYTGKDIPVKVQMKYEVRTRGNVTGDAYHFDSAELSDLNVESITISY